MRKTPLLILTAALLALTLFGFAGCDRTVDEPVLGAIPKSAPKKLTFFHTSDTHSKVIPFMGDPTANGTDRRMGMLRPDSNPYGGIARLATLLKWQRELSGANFYIDSGDIFQGHPIFNMFKGRVEALGMHYVGADVMAIGNHEFDNGTAKLVEQLEMVVDRPFFLLANYVFEDPSLEANQKLAELVRPYVILEKDGYRVGIIGMGDYESVTSLSIYGNSLGVMALDPVETINGLAAQLKPFVDLIVVDSHMGIDWDKDVFKKTRGVGLVFGGHSHVITNPPLQLINQEGKKVVVMHSGVDMKYLGRLDVIAQDYEIIDFEHRIFAIDSKCRRCVFESGEVVENLGKAYPETQDYRPCRILSPWDVNNKLSLYNVSTGGAVWFYGVAATSEQFSAASNLNGVFVNDRTVGPYAGIQVIWDKAESSSAVEGIIKKDSLLEITGTMDEYYGARQIRATKIKVLGGSETIPAVVIPDPASIANKGAKAEDYSGTLVEVRNVTVTDDALGHGNFAVSGGLVVAPKLASFQLPAAGKKYAALRGILTYAYGAFTLYPRGSYDMIEEGAADPLGAYSVPEEALALVSQSPSTTGICEEYIIPEDAELKNMLRPFKEALNVAQDTDKIIASSKTGFLRKEDANKKCANDEGCCLGQKCGDDGQCADSTGDSAYGGPCNGEGDCKTDETCDYDAGVCIKIIRGDSPLGNLISDSMRLFPRLSADFSITNSLGIRTDFPGGDLTVGKLYEVFPFENSLALVFLSGIETQQLFDFVAKKSGERGCANQVQFSGVQVVIDCEKRLAKEIVVGDKLENVGKPGFAGTVVVHNYKLVAPFVTFVVATNDYMAGGGSGFNVFRYNTTQFNTMISLRDVLVDYLSREKIDRCLIDYRAKMKQ